MKLHYTEILVKFFHALRVTLFLSKRRKVSVIGNGPQIKTESSKVEHTLDNDL